MIGPHTGIGGEVSEGFVNSGVGVVGGGVDQLDLDGVVGQVDEGAAKCAAPEHGFFV